MALVMSTGFTKIPEGEGGTEYKFKNFDTITIRFPVSRTIDPKAEIVLETVDYAYVDNKRIKLPTSEKKTPMSFMLSEILQNTDLQAALYHAEQLCMLLENYKNGDSNLSYTQHAV